jgi:lipopolysaccharide assembly protein A
MTDEQPRAKRMSILERSSTTAPRTRTSELWVGLILSALMLIFLLVFILQNRAPVPINFLGWTGTLPTGVALLFAAIAGMLLVAIPGSFRILQLRRAAREGRGP